MGVGKSVESLVGVLLLAAMCWSTLLICQLDGSGGDWEGEG